MKFILIFFVYLSFSFDFICGAPAVSSVYVRFVSGNKATQYAHGSLGDPTQLEYDVVESPNVVGEGDRHGIIRRRSLTQEIISTDTEIPKPKVQSSESDGTTTNYPLPSSSYKKRSKCPKCRHQREKNRIKFINDIKTNIKISPSTTITTTTAINNINNPISISTTTQSTIDPQNISNNIPKDTKAVKRSPFLKFDDFPEFDDYSNSDRGRGVDGFGSSDISHSSGQTQNNHISPESLAPEGLFLPPLPTAESNHIVDPYVVDAETAKYAANHPPYFHEFPHKRNVLALNEQRVHNGLEPNILRSIRPFFPFFEINKK